MLGSPPKRVNKKAFAVSASTGEMASVAVFSMNQIHLAVQQAAQKMGTQRVQTMGLLRTAAFGVCQLKAIHLRRQTPVAFRN